MDLIGLSYKEGECNLFWKVKNARDKFETRKGRKYNFNKS